jgi:hypothetical protein
MFRTNRTKFRFTLCFLLICSAISLMAQQASTADSVVPAIVKFTGTLNDADGKPLTGIQGVTFLFYKEQTGGAPLWIETQNVQADKSGRYTVMLGAATSNGLPTDAFKGGEARWLGVNPSGQAEQSRVVLVSVPYALKALDAETLGGRPASAFMVAQESGTKGSPDGPQAEQANEIVCSSKTACQTGFVPLFSSNGGSAKVNDSIVTQSGSTLTIHGSDAITGNESVSGSISASGLITGGFVGATNGSGAAIVGTSHGTSAGSDGVDGVTTSGTASGVAGINQSGGIGLYGTGGTGVAGFASGYGMYGQHAGASILGSEIPYAGIWGDTNAFGYAGVAGTGQDGVGGIFLSDSPSGYSALIAANYSSNGPIFSAENIANAVSCRIDQNAQLHCDGGIGAMVHLDSGKRKVALSAIQSPENWFEDFGSAQLTNGVAVIQLDPDFIQTVNTEKDYKVFPVPNGDCKGLYVTAKSADSFEVRELGGGSSNIRFDYRITAIRRNYERVRFADHTKDLDPRNMLEQMRKSKAASSASPASLKPAQPPVGAPLAQVSQH